MLFLIKKTKPFLGNIDHIDQKKLLSQNKLKKFIFFVNFPDITRSYLLYEQVCND
jgi:hypothetical protein